MVPTKDYLIQKYTLEKKSARDISVEVFCSENKIHYWLKKYNINKRSIKDATYLKANPNGDPYLYKQPNSNHEWFLLGLGIGLYWGEGNKANKHAIRLGNTDPALLRMFLNFLVQIYNIDTRRLRFGLQLFTDTNPDKAKRFWCDALSINPSQFHSTTITKQHKMGTYGKKSQYGVLTVYFSNRKLRDIIVGAIEKLQNENKPM